MRVNNATALEIFTKFDDLEIAVGKSDDLWGFVIRKGAEALIVTEPEFDRREAAIVAVIDTLKTVRADLAAEAMRPGTSMDNNCNPDNRPVNENDIISDEDISWITDQLISHGVARDMRARSLS